MNETLVLPVNEKAETPKEFPVKLRLQRKWPILVAMIDRYQDAPNPLKLTLVDKKKHWQGGLRKGRVIQVAAYVSIVKVGDVVYFDASDGFTLDATPGDISPVDESHFRFLKESECVAIEETVEVAS